MIDFRHTVSEILEDHGIKATANRIIVFRALMDARSPMTMKELEEVIVSLDKSSIFRVLVLLRENHLVHAIEACEEGTKYELCHQNHEEGESDEHVHFHCSVCHRTICFGEIPVPTIPLPDGYEAESVGYVITGICPECRSKH